MVSNLDMNNIMDGLFGAEGITSPPSSADVVQISLCDIYDKENHTFKPRRTSEDWDSFVESIRLYGVQSPVMLRHRESDKGRYECIAGHQRRAGSVEAGRDTVPAIIVDCTDDEADILMGITNNQRPDWLPSEKAKTWKAEYEALKRQGARTDLSTSRQTVAKSPEELIEKITGKDLRTVQRKIKLCDLTDPLLDLVDAKKIPETVAYHIAFLIPEHQNILEDLLPAFGCPSETDAEYFKKMQESNTFNVKTVSDYLTAKTKAPKPFKLTEKECINWFPPNYMGTSEDKKQLIKAALELYFEKEMRK